jgi:uncharacterized protein YuzE
MEDPVVKTIFVSIMVVFLATVVNMVVWSIVAGSAIMNDFQNYAVTSFSAVDDDAIVDLLQRGNVLGIDLYRVLEVNSASINEYSVVDETNAVIADIDILLTEPNATYDVIVTGSREAGYYIEAKKVASP